MRLFQFDAFETDWVAARDEAEARRHYMSEYGLNQAEMDDIAVSEVDDPESVTVYWRDEVDAETGECRQESAAEVMARVGGSSIVCSTAY